MSSRQQTHNSEKQKQVMPDELVLKHEAPANRSIYGISILKLIYL